VSISDALPLKVVRPPCQSFSAFGVNHEAHNASANQILAKWGNKWLSYCCFCQFFEDANQAVVIRSEWTEL